MYKKYEYITLICEIFMFFIFAKRGVWGDHNFLVKNHESQIDVFSLKLKKNGASGYSVPSIAFFYFSVAYVLKSFDNLFVM